MTTPVAQDPPGQAIAAVQAAGSSCPVITSRAASCPESVMGIIAWIILGLGAGLIANMLIPGRRSQGLILTCPIGIAGALAGGWVATRLFHLHHPLQGFFNLSTWLTAIAGAAVRNLTWAAGIKRLAARPFAQDILQVLEQSGAPTGSVTRFIAGFPTVMDPPSAPSRLVTARRTRYVSGRPSPAAAPVSRPSINPRSATVSPRAPVPADTDHGRRRPAPGPMLGWCEDHGQLASGLVAVLSCFTASC